MLKKDLKIPLDQPLYRAVFAQNPKGARPKRQQPQRAGDHCRGFRDGSSQDSAGRVSPLRAGLDSRTTARTTCPAITCEGGSDAPYLQSNQADPCGPACLHLRPAASAIVCRFQASQFVEVGTPVARCPPHRSRRAVFPHRALRAGTSSSLTGRFARLIRHSYGTGCLCVLRQHVGPFSSFGAAPCHLIL